jgi:hypothetical protein
MKTPRLGQPDVRELKNVDRRRSYVEFLERLTLGVSTTPSRSTMPGTGSTTGGITPKRAGGGFRGEP